jgi:hypothetical protein
VRILIDRPPASAYRKKKKREGNQMLAEARIARQARGLRYSPWQASQATGGCKELQNGNAVSPVASDMPFWSI